MCQQNEYQRVLHNKMYGSGPFNISQSSVEFSNGFKVSVKILSIMLKWSFQ